MLASTVQIACLITPLRFA